MYMYIIYITYVYYTYVYYIYIIYIIYKANRSVGKIIIIILGFRVGTSKNKNIDHRFKETCAQVTYETEYISVRRHSIMSSALALNICFACILL